MTTTPATRPTAAVLALAAILVQSPARADTAAATCRWLEAGAPQGPPVPCTFSQRQGYINVSLEGGDTYSFSPADEPGQYRDGQGERVERRLLDGDAQEFGWADGRTLAVTYQAVLPGPG